MKILEECARLLEAQIAVTVFGNPQNGRIAFEGAVVLGFVFEYENAKTLLKHWEADMSSAIAQYQLGLRRAEEKAWNTYAVFLTESAAEEHERVALSGIEENLIGTRKIARSAIDSLEALHLALLPLLPIRTAPHLEPIDMASEIRVRTSELPDRVVNVFLSEATDAVVIQEFESLT